MSTNLSEYLGPSPKATQFHHELDYDELCKSNEFTFTGDGGETLTCDLSWCKETRCSKQYKARCCPLSFCSWNDHTLYLQQHQNSSLELTTPALSELGIETVSKTQLKFKQVIPIARHRQDYHLLQFELQSERKEEAENLFMSINSDASETCVFSTDPGSFVDVLASSMAMKREALLACLFSYTEEFRRVNALSVEVFQEDVNLTRTFGSTVPWLSRVYSVPVYLQCLPSVLLPVLLHHPLREDNLVCFNINGEPCIESEKYSSSGISEIEWKSKSCSPKRDLFALLGWLSVIRTKFLHAQFSPDGHVLVVSCSTTGASWKSRIAAYVLFNSVTYQILTTVSVPLYREPVSANSHFNMSSLVCYKSYCPLFSSCGTKLGLITSPNHASVKEKKVMVYVYTIPVLMTLQSQCRTTIRRCVKEPDISRLELPPVLTRYLSFL